MTQPKDTQNEAICENCEETKYFHFKANRGAIWYCSKGHSMWTPKPTPDPKVEQVAKRPRSFTIFWREGKYFVSIPSYEGGEVVMKGDSDAKIASLEKELRETRVTVVACEDACRHLEKELRVTRRALEMAIKDLCSVPNAAWERLEAARKEGEGNG